MTSKELFNGILYPQPTDYSSLGYCISYLHCAIMYMSAKKIEVAPIMSFVKGSTHEIPIIFFSLDREEIVKNVLFHELGQTLLWPNEVFKKQHPFQKYFGNSKVPKKLCCLSDQGEVPGILPRVPLSQAFCRGTNS